MGAQVEQVPAVGRMEGPPLAERVGVFLPADDLAPEVVGDLRVRNQVAGFDVQARGRVDDCGFGEAEGGGQGEDVGCHCEGRLRLGEGGARLPGAGLGILGISMADIVRRTPG